MATLTYQWLQQDPDTGDALHTPTNAEGTIDTGPSQAELGEEDVQPNPPIGTKGVLGYLFGDGNGPGLFPNPFSDAANGLTAWWNQNKGVVIGVGIAAGALLALGVVVQLAGVAKSTAAAVKAVKGA